jgi:tRNA (guanine37-N1)-methyltransferase
MEVLINGSRFNIFSLCLSEKRFAIGEKVRKIPSLKVEKTLGEKAVTALKTLGVLNPDYKINREENYLFLPLNRKPSKTEVEELRTNLPKFEVVQYAFAERVEFQPRLVDLLSEKLPPHLLASLPQAIDFIGDIAVVEIPPELEKYRTVVGEAILKAHKQLSTALAKLGAVDGEFRVREFEPIAGVAKTSTVHREYGCVFYVDLAKAYFSPRLSYEHNRVASLVKEDETVLDMFTGVGPFAIHIAKKHQKVHVYAIDKNPDAIRLLKKNMTANRVEAKITPILGDARQIVAERLRGSSDRVIMNLPERALEYVDAACQAIKPQGGIIHYYEFTSESEPLEAAQKRLQQAVKQTGRKADEILSSRIVRGTAPFTWQVAVDARIK